MPYANDERKRILVETALEEDEAIRELASRAGLSKDDLDQAVAQIPPETWQAIEAEWERLEPMRQELNLFPDRIEQEIVQSALEATSPEVQLWAGKMKRSRADLAEAEQQADNMKDGVRGLEVQARQRAAEKLGQLAQLKATQVERLAQQELRELLGEASAESKPDWFTRLFRRTETPAAVSPEKVLRRAQKEMERDLKRIKDEAVQTIGRRNQRRTALNDLRAHPPGAADELRKAVTEKLGEQRLRDELAAAEAAVDRRALDSIVKDELRRLINGALDASFSESLGKFDAKGLREHFVAQKAIATEATARLRRALESMPGGSIGIAGPRGAGKSTLLRAFCGPGLTGSNETPIVTVFTQAPVQYEARDFILHLYGSLCRAVQRIPQTDQQPPAEQAVVDTVEYAPTARGLLRPRDFLRRTIFRLGVAALLVATLLLVSSVLLAWLKLQEKVSPITAASGVATKQASGNSTARRTQIGVAAPAARPARRDSATVAVQRSPILGVLEALGVGPGKLLNWGFSWLVAAIGLLVLSSSRMIYGLFRPFRLRAQPDSRLSPLETAYVERVSSRPPSLREQAEERLEGIRFQQSYTTGWSGALKFPIGLEGGLKQETSSSLRPLSLPELVEEFREFAGRVAMDYEVRIGIDELDKIQSDEKAQQFLNEVKAVFDVPNCFFLITVSENAMSNFERRGLPFRDAFDSTFDRIIHVDYLDLKGARQLIQGRILGLPLPFIGLCYCASGGLAREIVRSCRDLVDLAELSTERELSRLASILVERELQVKVRAVTIAVAGIDLEPDESYFLEQVRLAQTALGTAEQLLSCCKGLCSCIPQPSEPRTELAEVAEKRRRIAELADGFSAYIYYAATLLQLFAVSIPERERWEEPDSVLNLLARSRQYFAVNPNTARLLVTEVRQRGQLDAPLRGRLSTRHPIWLAGMPAEPSLPSSGVQGSPTDQAASSQQQSPRRDSKRRRQRPGGAAPGGETGA